MQTYFAVDPASTMRDESVWALAQYVAPGHVNIIAYSAGPDYTPPDMAASLKALYKCIRCPPPMATKGT